MMITQIWGLPIPQNVRENIRPLLKGYRHKVDKTEGASDKFPIWIFNFWPYGQLRAVREKNTIMNNFWAHFFHVFMGNFFLDIKKKIASFFWVLKYAARGIWVERPWGRFCSICFVGTGINLRINNELFYPYSCYSEK